MDTIDEKILALLILRERSFITRRGGVRNFEPKFSKKQCNPPFRDAQKIATPHSFDLPVGIGVSVFPPFPK